MAGDTLPPGYLKAGEDYLAALEKLGLRPEFLGWGQQVNTRDWWLVMVTSVVEISGPLVLGELLFKAYNMNATPHEISPFIVQVFGARSNLAPMLRTFGSIDVTSTTAQYIDPATNKPVGERHAITSVRRQFGDFTVQLDDIYRLQSVKKVGHEQRVRQWTRFKESVERLAA